MTNKGKAFIYGLAAVGIWSTVATAFKITLRQLDPLQLLLLACTVSLFALGGILAWQGKLHGIKTVSRAQLIRCALLGVLNPFLYYVILFKAYDLLPAQEAQPINYTWAITLSLLSIPILGQKMSGKDLAAIALSYLGVVTISTHGDILGLHFANPFGVGLALVSTLIWALYWVFNTKSSLDPILGLFLNFAFGLPLIFTATLYFSDIPSLSLQVVLGASYVGVFEMGVTFALWLSAMKFASMPDGGGTARVANLIFLSPFLSLVFIHYLLDEAILPATVVGLVMIIAGNALMQYAPRKRTT